MPSVKTAWQSPPKKNTGLVTSMSASELLQQAHAEAYPETMPRLAPAASSPTSKKSRSPGSSGHLPGLVPLPTPLMSKYQPDELDELRYLRLRNSELEVTIKRAVGMPRDAAKWQSIYWKEAEKLMDIAVQQYCGPGGGAVPSRKLSSAEVQRACKWYVSEMDSFVNQLHQAKEQLQQANSEIEELRKVVAETPSSNRSPAKVDTRLVAEDAEALLREERKVHAAELKKEREKVEKRLKEEHQRELDRQLKERLAKADMELERTLSKQKHELEGSASQKVQELERRAADLERQREEQRQQAEAKAKEERIELFGRQILRRIMSRDLSLGLTAWKERWQAKKYSLQRLRDCGNKLRDPGVFSKFIWWVQVLKLRLDRHRDHDFFLPVLH